MEAATRWRVGRVRDFSDQGGWHDPRISRQGDCLYEGLRIGMQGHRPKLTGWSLLDNLTQIVAHDCEIVRNE